MAAAAARAQQAVYVPNVTSPSNGDSFHATSTGGHPPMYVAGVSAGSHHPYSYTNNTGSQITDNFNITIILEHGSWWGGVWGAYPYSTHMNITKQIIINQNAGEVMFSDDLSLSSSNFNPGTFQTTAISYDNVNLTSGYPTRYSDDSDWTVIYP